LKGVFGCRYPHRPNALGLSLVRLVAVKGNRVVFAGADTLDGSLLLDIKPYFPNADRPESAWGGLTVFDLEDAELCCAPPFGSAKDPVNLAGFVAANVLRGYVAARLLSQQGFRVRNLSGGYRRYLMWKGTGQMPLMACEQPLVREDEAPA
jgi:hypothetical protein